MQHAVSAGSGYKQSCTHEFLISAQCQGNWSEIFH